MGRLPKRGVDSVRVIVGMVMPLAVPVLVVHGARDPRTEPGELDALRMALAGAGASGNDELRRRIASVLEAPDVHQADTTTGVTTDDLLAALRKAVENAKEAPA